MLLWIDGFEGYGLAGNISPTSALGRRYAVANATAATIVAGRTGGLALSTNHAGFSAKTPALTTQDTIIVGLAVKPTTTSYNGAFIELYDDATIGVNLWWDRATGELKVYRNTTLLGTTVGAGVTYNTWAYLELKVKCHATAGTVEVRVSGVTKLSLTNVNTKNGTHTYHNIVNLPSSVGWMPMFDDFWICDNSGTSNNDFLGNMKVVAIFPDAAGDAAEWTGSGAADHYTYVDEAAANDDTDYVESATTGAAELYGYQSPAAIGGVVAGVQINTDCRNTDATAFSLKTLAKSGETLSENAGQAVGSTDWVTRTRVVEIDPATGLPWTAEGLAGAQFGVKVG